MKQQKPPSRTTNYEWESRLSTNNITRRHSYDNIFGTTVLDRDANNKATRVKFSVYNPDTYNCLFLVGPFNDWGSCSAKELEDYRLTPNDSGFDTLTIDDISHNLSYLFLVYKDGESSYLRDPAAVFFDDDGNCVFWDYKDPSTYKKQYEPPDTLHRPSIVLQTDLLGLVGRWFEFEENASRLADSDKDLFTYTAECGVLDKIKELGYNTIQFLPVSQSIDGDNWKYHYLSPFPFAIHKNWGTPDSFMRLIDECHKRGIAVITDLILAHSPYKDYKLFNYDGSDIGIHLWKDENGNDVFLEGHTPWGTKRFRTSDENVRRYLIESTLHFTTTYGIDGFRIDNVDGILRYGDNGQGEERPYGRLFLRNLIKETYRHNPLTIFHLESHFFYGDNAKMLVAPLESDNRALGATAYNSSRLTYFLHTEYMLKAVEDISIWTIANIKDEKEWGGSNSTIADFHNHDAAAGLMENRATGSYAYHALTLDKPELDHHAVGKIRTMEAIIAFGCEGRILDLIQTFLLQDNTFEHDSSVHWELLAHNKKSRMMTSFKQAVNTLLTSEPAFWPENTLYREYTNVDEKNKVLVFMREDRTHGTPHRWYCIINLSDREHYEYRVGVKDKGKYHLAFDSTKNRSEKKSDHADKKTIEQNILSIDRPFATMPSSESTQFELFSEEIIFEHIAPYQILCVYHDIL